MKNVVNAGVVNRIQDELLIIIIKVYARKQFTGECLQHALHVQL